MTGAGEALIYGGIDETKSVCLNLPSAVNFSSYRRDEVRVQNQLNSDVAIDLDSQAYYEMHLILIVAWSHSRA